MRVAEKEIPMFSNICSVCGKPEFIVHWQDHCCIHCKDTSLVIEEYWKKVKKYIK
jgi:hypothetical protein